jgi:hypothetical protein
MRILKGAVKRYNKKYWMARITPTSPDGKRVPLRRFCRTKTEAQRALEELQAQARKIRGGHLSGDHRTRFAEVADAYEKANVFPAEYRAGVKVRGMRSPGNAAAFLRTLKERFGKKKVLN